MRRLVVVAVAFFLLLALKDNVFSQETASQPPPLAQALVREGDFAFRLAERLRIGTPDNEAEAESMLASTGIAPGNGWIADYPVTPDILGELQIAVGEAADSGRLDMGADEATGVFEDLAAEVGLALVADGEEEYPENTTSGEVREYPEPTIVNNYYYSQGPPVITYYLPPSNYYYLYAWVPSRFWCSGYFFPGFFILRDFHRTVVANHRRCVITNHSRDPKTRRVFTIDPQRRHTRDFIRHTRGPQPRGYDSPDARKGASSILERSREGTRTGLPAVVPSRGSFDRKTIPSGSVGRIERQSFEKGGKTRAFSRSSEQARGPVSDRGTSSAPVQAGLREVSGRASGQTGTIEGRNGTRSRGSSSGPTHPVADKIQ